MLLAVGLSYVSFFILRYGFYILTLLVFFFFLIINGCWILSKVFGEKGTTEDEMAGWHHRLDGREFEWTLGVGDGQGGLACCSTWACKESDMTGRLNWLIEIIMWFLFFSWLIWCITLNDLKILNHPCIPGINPTQSWCMILLMYCWIQFANILLKIFWGRELFWVFLAVWALV